jgi:hypothetical protein
MTTEVVQAVTSKKSDIPSHYIAISSYGCHKGNTDKKESEEYKSLYRAWCDGRIGGIKFMHSVHDKRGQIFIDPSDADRVILESVRAKPKPAAAAQVGGESALKFRVNGIAVGHCEAAVSALCEINNGITLMQATLERLATAVESIATQPKTPQQQLLHTFDSNGFHS